jgi:hypothetical protein
MAGSIEASCTFSGNEVFTVSLRPSGALFGRRTLS